MVSRTMLFLLIDLGFLLCSLKIFVRIFLIILSPASTLCWGNKLTRRNGVVNRFPHRITPFSELPHSLNHPYKFDLHTALVLTPTCPCKPPPELNRVRPIMLWDQTLDRRELEHKGTYTRIEISCAVYKDMPVLSNNPSAPIHRGVAEYTFQRYAGTCQGAQPPRN